MPVSVTDRKDAAVASGIAKMADHIEAIAINKNAGHPYETSRPPVSTAPVKLRLLISAFFVCFRQLRTLSRTCSARTPSGFVPPRAWSRGRFAGLLDTYKKGAAPQ